MGARVLGTCLEVRLDWLKEAAALNFQISFTHPGILVKSSKIGAQSFDQHAISPTCIKLVFM
jgi:hypothetical protein